MVPSAWVMLVINYSDNTFHFFDRKIQSRSYRMDKMHVHSKHELFYLEEGCVRYFVDDEIYILHPGDLILIPKNVFHKTDKLDCEQYKRILLSFDDSDFGPSHLSQLNDLSARRLISIPPSEQLRFLALFDRIELEHHLNCKGSQEILLLYLQELVLLAVRCQPAKAKLPLSESVQLVRSAANYISHNYGQDLSLEALSTEFSLSKSYFSRLFKKVTGVGVNEYINVVRITAAEKLLQNTSMSITQIASACGYNDSNYFSSVFKKMKGITPKKYASLKITKRKT